MYANGQGLGRDDAEALRWYRKAAEQGNAYAQMDLGSMYLDGRGVGQDPAEADRWFKRALDWLQDAAERGEAIAQWRLAVMYANALGVEWDDGKAVDWARRAALQGFRAAQLFLGNVYSMGQGVDQNYESAVAWFLRAAEQNSVEAMRNLGYIYERMSEPNDAEATRWFIRASERGSRKAWDRLHFLHDRMSGNPLSADYVPEGRSAVQVDLDQLRMMEDNVERGGGKGCAALHFCIARQYLKIRNTEKAEEHLRRASEKGHGGATYLLGLLHEDRQERWGEAERLLQLAADRGVQEAEAARKSLKEWQGALNTQRHADALAVQAELQMEGMEGDAEELPGQPGANQGAPRRREDAPPDWALRAAEGGDVRAMFILGRLYEMMEEPNYGEAVRWYLRAAEKGSDDAWEALDSLYGYTSGNPLSLEGQSFLPEERRPVHSEPDERLLAMEQNLGNLGECAALQFCVARQYLRMRDLEKAELHLRRAAGHGHRGALYYLGLLCEDQQRWESAEVWLTRAADRGVREAGKSLGWLKEFLELRGQ